MAHRAAAACLVAALALCVASCAHAEVVVFEDDFNSGFNVSVWKHEITAGGEGNWVSAAGSWLWCEAWRQARRLTR